MCCMSQTGSYIIMIGLTSTSVAACPEASIEVASFVPAKEIKFVSND
jgi:hypothetical protein